MRQAVFSIVLLTGVAGCVAEEEAEGPALPGGEHRCSVAGEPAFAPVSRCGCLPSVDLLQRHDVDPYPGEPSVASSGVVAFDTRDGSGALLDPATGIVSPGGGHPTVFSDDGRYGVLRDAAGGVVLRRLPDGPSVPVVGAGARWHGLMDPAAESPTAWAVTHAGLRTVDAAGNACASNARIDAVAVAAGQLVGFEREGRTLQVLNPRTCAARAIALPEPIEPPEGLESHGGAELEAAGPWVAVVGRWEALSGDVTLRSDRQPVSIVDLRDDRVVVPGVIAWSRREAGVLRFLRAAAGARVVALAHADGGGTLIDDDGVTEVADRPLVLAEDGRRYLAHAGDETLVIVDRADGARTLIGPASSRWRASPRLAAVATLDAEQRQLARWTRADGSVPLDDLAGASPYLHDVDDAGNVYVDAFDALRIYPGDAVEPVALCANAPTAMLTVPAGRVIVFGPSPAATVVLTTPSGERAWRLLSGSDIHAAVSADGRRLALTAGPTGQAHYTRHALYVGTLPAR